MSSSTFYLKLPSYRCIRQQKIEFLRVILISYTILTALDAMQNMWGKPSALYIREH